MMKRLFFLVMVVCLVGAMVLPSLAQSDGTAFRVGSTSLNVRTGPGIQYGVIGTIPSGAIFPVLGVSQTGNWVLLDLGAGVQGWAFSRLGGVYMSNRTAVPVTSAQVADSSLGQGGGGVPSTIVYMGTQQTGFMTQAEFNSTIGVTGSLRMRIGPGTEYRVTGIILDGYRATPLARTAGGGWIYVDYNGARGWVSTMYVVAPPALDLNALPVQQ